MLVLFLTVSFGSFIIFTRAVAGNADVLDGYIHFSNLDVIKSYFRNQSNPLAHKILETFEEKCLYTEDHDLITHRRKPFIVIEGNQRAFRDILGMKLARKLNGRYLINLPPCLYDYVKQVGQGSTMRRAFYLLCIYATIFNAKVLLNMNRAVVLNGGWLEQITFSLLQRLRGAPTPPVTSDLFQYPTDLLQPDITIYVDQQGFTLPNKVLVPKERFVELYQMLSNRYPIMFQPVTKIFKGVVDEVYSNMKQNMSSIRSFSVLTGFRPSAFKSNFSAY